MLAGRSADGGAALWLQVPGSPEPPHGSAQGPAAHGASGGPADRTTDPAAQAADRPRAALFEGSKPPLSAG